MSHELQIALQLYTIRDEMERDFTSALGKVAGHGYKGVEFFDYGGLASLELRKVLVNLNLKAVNTHVSLARMEENTDKELKYASEMGLKDLTIPRLPEDRRRNRDDYFKFADTLEAIGAQCHKEGIRLHFHNHYYEFDLFGDKRGMDIILENTSAANLSIELDTFWVEYAGIDAVEYLRKNAARIEMIHLKDMLKDREPPFAEIGNGTMDISSILNAAEASDVKWAIVEQDSCVMPQLQSVITSIKYLKKIGWA